MAAKMKDVKVILLGEVYRCPTCWTVQQVEERIRASYALYGGRMECDGVVIFGTARLVLLRESSPLREASPHSPPKAQ
jgi:hypothetical protein